MLYEKDQQVWGGKQWRELMATAEYQKFQKSETRRHARQRRVERQSEAANQPVPLRPPPGASSSSRRPKPTKSSSAAATASSSSSTHTRPSSSASSTSRRREIGPTAESPAVRKLMRQRLDPEDFRRVGNQVAKEHRMVGNLTTAGSVVTPSTSSASSHRRGTGTSSLSRR